MPVARSVRMLSGWGRTASSSCRVIQPREAADVLDALGSSDGWGVIARGSGRSYGDAAQNGGGTVLDMTALDQVLGIYPHKRLVTAQAGATIAQILARLAEYGLTLPVVPGTRHVTLAGAIASERSR